MDIVSIPISATISVLKYIQICRSLSLTSAVFLRFKEPAAQASIVSAWYLVGATLGNTVVIDVVEIAALLRRPITVAVHEAHITLNSTAS